MGFSALLDQPFYTGTSATTLTPYPYDVSIDGHPYMVSTDPNANEKWGVRLQQTSLPLLRDQTDNSDSPGEQSLSPNQLWRRSVESWHLGAGQMRYDRKTSTPYRFYRSRGVDVWTQGQLSLLDGVLGTASGFTALLPTACVAGSRYYAGGGTGLLYWSSDLNLGGSSTRNTVTGLPATTVTSVCSDGTNVYVACSGSGVYKTTTSSSAATSYATGTATLVGFHKGRLLVAGGGLLYNPTATGALASPLIDLSGQGWTWTAFGAGATVIYAAGYAGDQSSVYAITIKPDGTALTTPTVAATLPTGEIARAVYGYLGFVVVGTDKGVRFCNPDSNGNLTLGGLIPTGSPVYDFVGQDRFVWFTWSAYETGASGLGRLDLSNFTSDLTPAYATDLMKVDPLLISTPVIRNVDVWNNLLVFTSETTSTGVFIQDTTAQAYYPYLETGTIGFGIGDLKAAVFADVRHDPLTAGSSVKISLAVDQGSFSSLGVSSTTGSTGAGRTFNANQVSGETFSLRLDLNPDSGSGPDLTVHRLTLRAYPQATRVSEYTVPIILRDTINPDFAAEYYCNIEVERDYLTSLWRSQKIVNYQEGNISTLVTVSDINFLGEKRAPNSVAFSGTMVVTLREVLA